LSGVLSSKGPWSFVDIASTILGSFWFVLASDRDILECCFVVTVEMKVGRPEEEVDL
jgi:hypothetical protein